MSVLSTGIEVGEVATDTGTDRTLFKTLVDRPGAVYLFERVEKIVLKQFYYEKRFIRPTALRVVEKQRLLQSPLMS